MKEEGYTAREWILSIQDYDMRHKAIVNFNQEKNKKTYKEDRKHDSLGQAILHAFSWENTPEGADFWNKFSDANYHVRELMPISENSGEEISNYSVFQIPLS